jgi:soluble lytic murein transglycosylase
VTARTSTRLPRVHSSRSGRRSRPGRRSATKRRRSRRTSRRRAIIGGTIAFGLLAGLVVAKTGVIQDALREVTLPLRHDDIIRQQAADKEVPADLIAAVIYAESRFRDQTSHAGARGLMQVTPQTAKLIERLSGGSTFTTDDLADPDINIRYGTYYLRYLIDRFDGNITAALAAYNAGETNVAAWGGSELELEDIKFEDTRGYVEDVLDKREDYADHYGNELGLE